MFRTLSDLRDSVNRRIEELGADAPCAAYIFTEEDVLDCYDVPSKEDVTKEDQEKLDAFIEDVLSDIGDSDYVYEQINFTLEDSVKDHLHKVQF
jgi:hypothetical protein